MSAAATPAPRSGDAVRLAIELNERDDAAELGVTVEELRKARAEGRDLEHEAEQRTAALGMAERPCDPAALREREQLRLVSLADLPDGWGWGEELDRLTGGGLARGELLGIGAPDAGGGKTALLAQFLDGLALRSDLAAEDPEATAPLTPGMLVTEMDPTELECRTLGRLLGVPGTMFTAGVSARRWHPYATVQARYNEAAAAMEPGGTYARICRWQHVMRAGGLAGQPLLNALEEHGKAWVAELERSYPGREIVPVLALDPINSALPLDGRSEVETLGEVSNALDSMAERLKWIVAFTSETNKASAKGEDQQQTRAAAIYRGSMQLLHRSDVTLVVLAGNAGPDGVTPVTVMVDKNRRGPRRVAVPFRWHVKAGLRFVPDDPVRADREAQEQDQRKATGERLRDLAQRHVTAGEELTESKLERGLHRDAGIHRADVAKAVLEAIEDNLLLRGPPPRRGGGKGVLLPGLGDAGAVAGAVA